MQYSCWQFCEDKVEQYGECQLLVQDTLSPFWCTESGWLPCFRKRSIGELSYVLEMEWKETFCFLYLTWTRWPLGPTFSLFEFCVGRVDQDIQCFLVSEASQTSMPLKNEWEPQGKICNFFPNFKIVIYFKMLLKTCFNHRKHCILFLYIFFLLLFI